MRLRRGLSCRELVELVTDYLESALPAHEHRRFERHIRKCDGCTAYLEQMRVTIELTSRLRTEDVPPAALEPLLTAFRDWHAG
jgi:anti-sigma factor RsiW